MGTPATRPRTYFPQDRRTRIVVVTAILTVVVLVAVSLFWALWRAPSTPARLKAIATAPTTIRVSWAPRSTGTPVGRYLILRDDVEIGSVRPPITFFTDSGTAPGSQHAYRVIAARGSKRSRAQASPAIAVTPAPSPTGLRRLAVTPHSATIGWTAPADAPSPHRYILLLDGRETTTYIGLSPATQAQVTGLRFGTGYTIQLRAAWVRGGTSQPSAALEISTPNPPVSEARLDGSAGVPVRFTVRSSNWKNLPVGKVFTDSWTLTPTCATGPCPVTLDASFHSSGHGVRFRLLLARNGAVYSGSTRASVATCWGKQATSTITVTITVRAAAGPQWLASAWNGTIESRNPYLSRGRRYCPAGKSVATISWSQDVRPSV